MTKLDDYMMKIFFVVITDDKLRFINSICFFLIKDKRKKMSSPTIATVTKENHDTVRNFIDENEEQENIFENRKFYRRSSFVPRQISFSQRQATFGEIILILLPYFILLVDIFIFFLLRGFKLT